MSSSEVTTDRLVEDLKTVMQDAEALLKATSAYLEIGRASCRERV